MMITEVNKVVISREWLTQLCDSSNVNQNLILKGLKEYLDTGSVTLWDKHSRNKTARELLTSMKYNLYGKR